MKINRDLKFDGIVKNYDSHTMEEFPAHLVLFDPEEGRQYIPLTKEQIIWIASTANTQLLALAKAAI